MTRRRRLRRPVCIYVDNSNIFIGAQETAKIHGEEAAAVRIAFANFLFLVTHGTMEFDRLVWAGSGNEDLSPVFAELKGKGADVRVIPRSEGGEHEAVDHEIQLAMYRDARKFRKSPGTMILCSGDGKGSGEERGFLFDLRGFHEDGWAVRLYSWDGVCHQELKHFAQESGLYIPLDAHYESITFLKDGRTAQPVHL